MDSREEILDILRKRPLTSHSHRKIRKAELIKGNAHIFARNAWRVGASVIIVPDIEVAREEITRILLELEGDIVYSSEHIIKDINISDLAKNSNKLAMEAQIESISNYKREVLTSKIGISSCRFAIQETGSIIIAHGNCNESLISLAPETHICILNAEQILENKYVLATELEKKTRLPSSYTIITGVSRSATPELHEMTGMYGPKNLFILIIK